MPFDQEGTVQLVPTTIRTIEVTLFSGLEDEDSAYGKKYARAEIRVDDQMDQPIKWVRVDLENHLSAQMLSDLNDFMNFLRNKAESEILP